MATVKLSWLIGTPESLKSAIKSGQKFGYSEYAYLPKTAKQTIAAICESIGVKPASVILAKSQNVAGSDVSVERAKKFGVSAEFSELEKMAEKVRGKLRGTAGTLVCYIKDSESAE